MTKITAGFEVIKTELIGYIYPLKSSINMGIV